MIIVYLLRVLRASVGAEKSCHAPALKPTHEAGGRGGESTARNNDDYDFILSAISSKESKNALTKLSLLTVVKF